MCICCTERREWESNKRSCVCVYVFRNVHSRSLLPLLSRVHERESRERERAANHLECLRLCLCECV